MRRDTSRKLGELVMTSRDIIGTYCSKTQGGISYCSKTQGYHTVLVRYLTRYLYLYQYGTVPWMNVHVNVN